MFCFKCGAKAIDGAVFCQKCGAKLIQDNREEQELIPDPIQESGKVTIPSVQTPLEGNEKSAKEKELTLESEPIQVLSSKPKETLTTPVEPVAVSLQESAETSTASTKPMALPGNNQSDFYSSEAFRRNDKNFGSTIKPYYCMQFSRIESGEKTNFNWAAFFFSGWNMLYNGCNKLFCMTFLPLSVVVFIGQVFNALGVVASNSSLVNISVIMIGIAWPCSLILSIINGFKFNTWYYQDVSHNPEKQRNRKGLWIYLITVGIVSILITVIPYIFTPTDENIYDDYSDEFVKWDQSYEQTENIKLSQTYINEDEGFSFMYPDNWDIMDAEEVDPDDPPLVYVACTGLLGTYASINVVKEADDGSLFAYTRSDFEAGYSSETGVSNVKVMDLSDIELDGCPARKLTVAANIDGVRYIFIQYFYIHDSYMYLVTCGVEKYNYETYEPRFNAIMESYTIIKTAFFHEQTGSNEGDLCYGEVPLIDLLNKSEDEVCSILGSPVSGTPVTGELLFGGTEYYIYNGLELYFDNQTDTVSWISVRSDLVKIGGETLDKNRTELINLLGQPTYEDYYYDESGEFADCYYMQFTLYETGFNLDIEMPDSMGYADWVTIYEYDDSSFDDWDERESDYELSDFSYEMLYLYGGSYEGNYQTSVYVNIYSSFDEGNTVGNVFLYDSLGHETFALIRDDNEGEGIYTLCFDDLGSMYIRFYQDFYGGYYVDIQGLDNIYTNVNGIETYVMTEQYIP